MFSESRPRKRIFTIAVLISIILVLAAFYYVFFAKDNNKVPSRGVFVNNFNKSSEVCMHNSFRDL